MSEQEKRDMDALRRALKYWRSFHWDEESIALGWFLCLGYRNERARDLAGRVDV